jgi:hypothetical protein
MLVIKNIDKIAGRHIETTNGIFEIYNIIVKDHVYGFTLRNFMDHNNFVQLKLARTNPILYNDHYQLSINGLSGTYVMLNASGLSDKEKFLEWMVELLNSNWYNFS